MVLSVYCKQRILFYYSEGICSSNRIKRQLEEVDNIVISRVAIWKFLRRYAELQCLSRKEGSGRPSKITPEVKVIVERQMEVDDETTACQLHKILNNKGFSLSLSTILRCRKELGWTFRGKSSNVATYQVLHYSLWCKTVASSLPMSIRNFHCS